MQTDDETNSDSLVPAGRVIVIQNRRPVLRNHSLARAGAYTVLQPTPIRYVVCVLDILMSPAKIAKPIKAPFGTWTLVGLMNHILDEGPDSTWTGVLLGETYRYFGTSRWERKRARCYFNAQSKADMSQLNLLHGTNN